MTNILFINPPNIPYSSKGILIEPIDLLHVATQIDRLNYNVSILDMDVSNFDINNFEEYLTDNDINIIVIVCDYHIPLHNEGANITINKMFDISERNKVVSILGGKSATFYSEKQLQNIKANFYIAYDLESPLENLLDSLINNKNINEVENIRYWDKDKLITNTVKKVEINLDSYAIPNRDLINLEKYIDVRTMLTSRGCNLKCTFCHVPNFWGNWKFKSAENVVKEIVYLKENFNSKKILFLDDNAMAQPRRMLEISKLLKKEKVKISLGCLATIVSFDYEIYKEMYSAGFRWIHFGIESGNDVQLKLMKKKITALQAKDVIRKTQEIGLRVRTSWILDFPNATIESVLETEKLILEQDSEEIRLHFLTLRLGSELFDKNLIETQQYIHNNKQNLNISGVDDNIIKESLNRIIVGLKNKGYKLVINPDDFLDVDLLKENNPNLKIVSLCPLRYGLGWYE